MLTSKSLPGGGLKTWYKSSAKFLIPIWGGSTKNNGEISISVALILLHKYFKVCENVANSYHFYSAAKFIKNSMYVWCAQKINWNVVCLELLLCCEIMKMVLISFFIDTSNIKIYRRLWYYIKFHLDLMIFAK